MIRWLRGAVLAASSVVCGWRRPRVKEDDLAAHQWRDSTQRMGIRFTERIRDVWRKRWLRSHSPGNGET
jgi:hypothetical protein